MEGYVKAGEATNDSIIIRLMRFACQMTKPTNTHSEYKTYCISKAKIVMRTPLNITPFIHCLSCFYWWLHKDMCVGGCLGRSLCVGGCLGRSLCVGGCFGRSLRVGACLGRSLRVGGCLGR